MEINDILISLEEKYQKILIDEGIDYIDVVDSEFVRDGGYNYYRVFIENTKDKTSLDDCEKVSKLIDGIADYAFNEAYMLEVSTPGIERSLKKEKDFIRFMNNKVEVKTKKSRLIGSLNEYNKEYIVVDQEKILFKDIKKVKLIYDFNEIKEMEEAK